MTGSANGVSPGLAGCGRQAIAGIVAILLTSALNLSATAEEPFRITDEARAYWAFQPVKRPGAGSIDNLVDAQLAREGLRPNGNASRRVLIRRAYFDLIGLPPSYEEILASENDPDPNAFANLIDRLLAMPEYGERWGRHWLDVVRFAQTDGYERDDEKRFAWRYRDYVIDSFNSDKPYDRFILEQLAGDELPDGGDDAIIATGFYRLGVFDDEPDDKRAAEHDALDDVIRTTGEAFMGMTLGCARCHHHMFDPFSQRNYYEFQAFFRNIQQYDKKDPKESGGYLKLTNNDHALAVREHGANPKETFVLVRGDAGVPADRVDPKVPEILAQGANPGLKVAPGKQSTGRRLALARWIASADHPLTARVMANRIWQHHFGQAIVTTPNDFGRAGVPPSNQELLDWLAAEFVQNRWSIKHLHKTIMMSRAWQRSSAPNAQNHSKDPGNKHFWRQNLRRMEAEAVRDAVLVASGSLNTERGGRGFYPLLNGEVVAGGSRPGRGWGFSSDIERRRRSVYTFIKRTMGSPLLEVFDSNNTENPVGVRPVTTVAPQALMLLNSRFVSEQARMLAQSISKSSTDDREVQITQVFRRALRRNPTVSELEQAVSFIESNLAIQREQISRMGFRPEVPAALFKDYQSALPPEQFLVGPEDGWQYYKGTWTGGYEGIVNVTPGLGPFALYQPVRATRTTVHGRMRIGETTEFAGLIFNAVANADGGGHTGVDFLIDRKSNKIELRVWDGKSPSVVAETNIAPGSNLRGWLTFRIESSATEMEAILSASSGGHLAKLHATGLALTAGHFGVRSWGGDTALEDLTISADGKVIQPHAVDHEKSDQKSADNPSSSLLVAADLDHLAATRALAEFCSVLFNLNEFLYVD